MTATRKRPWLAAALSLLYPGLGHLYLREWVRAGLWFALIVSASVVLVPTSATPETMSVSAIMDASSSLPTYVAIAMLTLTMFSMIDAYALAIRRNQRASQQASDPGEITRCPSCGHELEDDDIGFCPWCAEQLVEPDERDESGDDPTSR